MSDTYSDVDRWRNVDEAVAWQDRINTWPQMRAYKRRTYELLDEHTPVLDVGCGSGLDAHALRGFGVDSSRGMCERARARGIAVARANAMVLPFADHTFGGVRADRVIQHVADPEHAVSEMVRVTRPGGRVVVADPNQETLVIDAAGAPRELLLRLKELRRDVGYRNGTFIGRLPALLGALGLHDITTEAFPLVLTDPDDAFGLPTWVAYWQERARFSDADVARWDEVMAQARAEGGFVFAVLYFVVSGVR